MKLLNDPSSFQPPEVNSSGVKFSLTMAQTALSQPLNQANISNAIGHLNNALTGLCLIAGVLQKVDAQGGDK